MREKGFTLFTALVAFILIVLVMLLVQSMASTERSISGIVSDIGEQQEMQALADFARADALQVFNFNIRHNIEEFLTATQTNSRPSNSYVILPSTENNWEVLKKNFIKDKFGTETDSGNRRFASITSQNLVTLLERQEDARGFDIDLVANQGNMELVLDKTYEESESNNDFFEVVGCSSADFDECVGSFYVTIDTTLLTDEEYENFPKIVVENRQTGRKLNEIILPRGKFRIYIPTRFFKAIAGASEINSQIDRMLNYDFFDEKSKNESEQDIKNVVLGVIESNDENGTFSHDGFFLLDYWAVVNTDEDDIITSYRVELVFKETNPQYRVNTEKETVYGVEIHKFF